MMSDKSHFRVQLSLKLNEFKRAYRSNLSPKIRSELNLNTLNITRKQTKSMSDQQLFETCHDLTGKLTEFLSENNKKHAGLNLFIRTMQETLNEYTVIGNAVVHEKSFCNKHILNVIQHTQSIQYSVNNSSLQEIKSSGKALIEFGREDYVDQLIELMMKNKDHCSYFSRLASYFINLKKAYDDDPLSSIPN